MPPSPTIATLFIASFVGMRTMPGAAGGGIGVEKDRFFFGRLNQAGRSAP